MWLCIGHIIFNTTNKLPCKGTMKIYWNNCKAGLLFRISRSSSSLSFIQPPSWKLVKIMQIYRGNICIRCCQTLTDSDTMHNSIGACQDIWRYPQASGRGQINTGLSGWKNKNKNDNGIEGHGCWLRDFGFNTDFVYRLRNTDITESGTPLALAD